MKLTVESRGRTLTLEGNYDRYEDIVDACKTILAFQTFNVEGVLSYIVDEYGYLNEKE